DAAQPAVARQPGVRGRPDAYLCGNVDGAGERRGRDVHFEARNIPGWLVRLSLLVDRSSRDLLRQCTGGYSHAGSDGRADAGPDDRTDAGADDRADADPDLGARADAGTHAHDTS